MTKITTTGPLLNKNVFQKTTLVQWEGRVYFIINKFPIDSGVRIPPGEVYPVSFSGKTGEHFLDSCPLRGPLLFAIKEKEPKHNLRKDKDIFMLKLLLFFVISCYRNPTQLELTKQKNPGDYSHYSQLN